MKSLPYRSLNLRLQTGIKAKAFVLRCPLLFINILACFESVSSRPSSAASSLFYRLNEEEGRNNPLFHSSGFDSFRFVLSGSYVPGFDVDFGISVLNDVSGE